MVIEELKKQILDGIVKRRNIRYRLFRIKERKSDEIELKNYIESQFKNGMDWDSFTFNWDVAPNDPLKVIEPFEWILFGGKQNMFGCSPPAFTRQE